MAQGRLAEGLWRLMGGWVGGWAGVPGNDPVEFAALWVGVRVARRNEWGRQRRASAGTGGSRGTEN